MRMTWTRFALFAPLAIVGMAAFIFAGGFVVMWLWNWLLPPILGRPEITLWQGIGLLALCRILFGGFRLGGPRPWRRQYMSAQEKERFRHRMRERWGCDAPAAGDKGSQTI